MSISIAAFLSSKREKGSAPMPSGPAPPQPVPQQADTATILKLKLLEIFEAGDGGDLAGRFIQLVHPPTYDFLSKQTEADILKSIREDPVFASIKDHPELNRFVEEMVKFFKEPETDTVTEPVQ